MKNDPYTTYENGWIFRIRPPEQPRNCSILVLLHGWSGDENVMWFFTRNLPANICILAPRGRLPVEPSGYGWISHPIHNLPSMSDIQPLIEPLLVQIDFHLKSLSINQRKINVMGFSQGAALAYALLFHHPQRISRLAALAGFLPRGAQMHLKHGILSGVPIFISHGTEDEIVPVDIARQDKILLEQAGANVTYCEEAVGHKLSSGCFRSLNDFLIALSMPNAPG